MSRLIGLYNIHPSPLANKPHILGFQTARAANDPLFELWNGSTSAARLMVWETAFNGLLMHAGSADGFDSRYLSLAGGGSGGAGQARGASITVFGNEFTGAEGKLHFGAGDVAAGGHIEFFTGASVKRFVIQRDGNIALWGAGSFGTGTLVLFVANASVVPSTNPVGGGILYAEGGALKWRGSAGTVTTLGAA